MESSLLIFVQEAVYFKYKNEYYSDRIEYPEYWQKYFNHFDKIVVLARVRKIEEITSNLRKSSGDNIDFIELPYYNGFLGYLKNKNSIINIFKNNLNRDCTYILRIPGPLGSLYARVLKQNKIDYAVEVVGDPEEVIKHLTLPIPKLIKNIIARYAGKKMKAIVANAKGALYVTTSILQKKYPTFVNIPTIGVSDVIIHNSNIVQRDVKVLYESIQNRLFNTSDETVKIGVLGRLYAIKSPMETLDSIINLITDKGYNLEIIFAGDGPLLEELKNKSKVNHISKRVKLLGSIKNVNEFLDSIDLFIQFSKTEGIPRATLEAMTRGCPVIASKVGGLEELLSNKFLVESGDIEGLSLKIEQILTDRSFLEENLKSNYETVMNNTIDKLNYKRFDFYEQIKQ